MRLARSAIIKAIITGDSAGLKDALTGADSALGRFRSSVTGADSVGGKFKAGWASASESIQANAGKLAIVGGAALVKFGLDAVTAFTGLAKSTLDASAATGIGVESMSRWIAVADDFEVSSESLVKGVGRLDKTIVSNAKSFDALGIATKDASGATRDADQILIDSLVTLGQLTNATDRVTVGTQLFGKRFEALAPIVGKTRAEYEKMLGAVSDGQVITQDEIAQAEAMRLAKDQLSDALQDLSLNAGKALVQLTPLVVKAAEFIEIVGKLGDQIGGVKLGEVTEDFYKMRSGVEAAGLSWADWFEKLTTGQATMADLEAAIAATSYSTEHMGIEASDAAAQTDKLTQAAADLAGASAKVPPHLQDMAREGNRAKGAIRDLDSATKALLGALNADVALINFKERVGELATEAFTAEAGSDAQRKAVDLLKITMIEYVSSLEGVPTSKKTEIIAQIKAGELQAAQAQIDLLTAPKIIPVTVSLQGIPGQQALKDFTTAAAKQAVQPGGAKKNGENAGINIGVMNITDGRTIATELNTTAALYGR